MKHKKFKVLRFVEASLTFGVLLVVVVIESGNISWDVAPELKFHEV